MNYPTISPGSQVLMHFCLSLIDGTEVSSSLDGDAETFTMGDGSLEPLLECRLYGLKAGDKQSFTLSPAESYGFPDENKIHRLNKDSFPSHIELAENKIISFNLPNGDETMGMIQQVDKDSVIIDFNHPLAGRDITFQVEIIEVTNP
jgi:FKBP-type peptidyl-prolyl cis-trans isomerase SlpA